MTSFLSLTGNSKGTMVISGLAYRLERGSSGWSFDAAESAKLTVDVASSAKER